MASAFSSNAARCVCVRGFAALCLASMLCKPTAARRLLVHRSGPPGPPGVPGPPGPSNHCKELKKQIRAMDGQPGENPVFSQIRSANAVEMHGVLNDMDVTVARYHEDKSWTQTLKQEGASIEFRPSEGSAEQIAFVKAFIANYDSKRNVSVYLHGGSPHDWHSPRSILDIIKAVNPDKLLRMGGYASLNLGNYMTQNAGIGAQSALFNYRMDCLWKDDKWVRMLKSRWHLQDEGTFDHWGGYCCGQFVLHRKALQAWPKEFYQSLLERLESMPDVDHNSYTHVARDMEYLWHVIFTGKPVIERHYTQFNFTSSFGVH